jgi:hypothetical protein
MKRWVQCSDIICATANPEGLTHCSKCGKPLPELPPAPPPAPPPSAELLAIRKTNTLLTLIIAILTVPYIVSVLIEAIKTGSR